MASFPRWSGLPHFSSVMETSFTDGTKEEAIAKEIGFCALNVLTKEKDPNGWLLLRCLHAFRRFNMYTALTLHTTETIRKGQLAAMELSKRIQEYSRKMEAETWTSEHKRSSWNFPKAHTYELLKVIGKMGPNNENDNDNLTTTASPAPTSRQSTPAPRSSTPTTNTVSESTPVETAAAQQEDAPVVVVVEDTEVEEAENEEATDEEAGVEVNPAPQVAAPAVRPRAKRGTAGVSKKPPKPAAKPAAKKAGAKAKAGAKKKGATERGGGRGARDTIVEEEEEVSTEEEVPPPRPKPTRLTRHGASIHIECGDEETSD
ncbi:hypothetical protein PQX77_016745 [Marasmius sp. AFHP31]|nr:hypothetical protein PQX77_016745 [Marasmius sp. AFHP31]